MASIGMALQDETNGNVKGEIFFNVYIAPIAPHPPPHLTATILHLDKDTRGRADQGKLDLVTLLFTPGHTELNLITIMYTTMVVYLGGVKNLSAPSGAEKTSKSRRGTLQSATKALAMSSIIGPIILIMSVIGTCNPKSSTRKVTTVVVKGQRLNRRSARDSPPAARNSCVHWAGAGARNHISVTLPAIKLSIVIITFRPNNGINKPAERRKGATLAPVAHRRSNGTRAVGKMSTATVVNTIPNLRNEPRIDTEMYLAREIGNTKREANNGTATANYTTKDSMKWADTATDYGNIIALSIICICRHRVALKAQVASKLSSCNAIIRVSAAEASSSRG